MIPVNVGSTAIADANLSHKPAGFASILAVQNSGGCGKFDLEEFSFRALGREQLAWK
jgi:hypothetical protein